MQGGKGVDVLLQSPQFRDRNRLCSREVLHINEGGQNLEIVFDAVVRLGHRSFQSQVEVFDLLFRLLPVGDVTGETARMQKLAVFPKNIGTDEDVTHGAVFAAQTRFAAMQGLIGSQPPQNILDRVFIRVKFRDMMTDVLVRSVTEKVEFGFVRPQYRSVSSHPMQSDCRIFKEVAQFPFTWRE